MNNKALGTAFERELCQLLQDMGMWVHFIEPNRAGQQPFDIIAVSNNIPIAIDCKTSARAVFPYSRLEDNQKFAFEKWLECGNEYAVIAVKYTDKVRLEDKIYFIDYEWLKGAENERLKLSDCAQMKEWFDGRF